MLRASLLLFLSVVSSLIDSTEGDHYAVLGVRRGDDSKTIKKSYKKLAMKYHPDHNSDEGAREKFMEIQKSYGILSDDDKRRTYDLTGHDGEDNNGRQQHHHHHPFHPFAQQFPNPIHFDCQLLNRYVILNHHCVISFYPA